MAKAKESTKLPSSHYFEIDLNSSSLPDLVRKAFEASRLAAQAAKVAKVKAFQAYSDHMASQGELAPGHDARISISNWGAISVAGLPDSSGKPDFNAYATPRDRSPEAKAKPKPKYVPGQAAKLYTRTTLGIMPAETPAPKGKGKSH